MDDPKVIAARVAKEATETVDDAAKVATDAFNKINHPEQYGEYTAKEATRSVFELARIAIKGAADMARIPLQTQPDPRVMLLADHITTVVRRGLLEATQVASDACDLVDDDKFDKDEWVKSGVKFAHITMLRGAEIAQTIAAGPGAYADTVLTSDPITVDPRNFDRTLRVESLGRHAVPNENIAALVGFDPADGILLANATSFRLVANSAGIPSGVYEGRVRLCKVGSDIVDDTKEVSFPL
ncbi:MAG: hypothetical protein JWR37_2638 [Mycobacterium sp.]|jgi:hypothetical protein|nr:hypothetical protein [Mycobacterium sp.]